MNKKVSKKRIALALLPLLVFNAVLVLNMLFVKDWVLSQAKNEWTANERLYTSKETHKYEQDGQFLFSYEGSDGDCWKIENDTQRGECFEEHSHGGLGTMTIGGNLVVENAESIYLNGFDGSGYNWLMTGSSEPYNNALGTHKTREANLLHGNNMVVNGNLKGGALAFAASESYVGYDQDNCYLVEDGAWRNVSELQMVNKNANNERSDLIVLETPVCGDCLHSCAGGGGGRDYKYFSNEGVDVKGLAKIDGKVRLCGYKEQCEKEGSGLCCRVAEYTSDNTYGNFLASTCDGLSACRIEDPPDNCDGRANCTYCYPQPYPDEECYDPDPNDPTFVCPPPDPNGSNLVSNNPDDDPGNFYVNCNGIMIRGNDPTDCEYNPVPNP